jgi:hypothetical protein
MRKTNLLALSVIAAVLLSSAFPSIVSAQIASEGSEPATSTDVASVPEQTVDPEAADKADETRIMPSDENATSPDTPVIDDEAVLYTTQDDGNSLIAPAPRGEDTNLESAQNSPDYSLPLVAVGTLLAIIVGGAIGVTYYRKQAAKVQTQ